MKSLTSINERITEAGFKPQQVLLAGTIGIAVLLSLPSLGKFQQIQAERRDTARQIDLKLESQNQLLEVENNEQKIANERYKNCIPVVGSHYVNNTHYFTSLREGEIPIDRIAGKPFSRGVKVCDAMGSVGVINEKGEVVNILFTGDRDVVQTRIKRFRGSQFSQPVVSNNKQTNK